MDLLRYVASLAIFLVLSLVLMIGAHLILQLRSRATAKDLAKTGK